MVKNCSTTQFKAILLLMDKVNTRLVKFALLLSLCALPLVSLAKSAGTSIILYTPYTSRSITPGKSIKYNIQIINRTHEIQDVQFYYIGIPKSWNPSLSASANTINEIAVKPKNLGNNSESLDLDLSIPLKIKKGRYHFKLVGKTTSGLEYVLPLEVNVTKRGIFKTDMEISQANMEGYANSHFTYDMNLVNRTGQKQNYALIADTPPGWDVRFRANGDYVTSVSMASGKTTYVSIKVTTPPEVKAGKYNIIIHATSGSTSEKATLVTVIKGKYGLKLTTPTGLLSSHITAGGKKEIKLQLKNTGTLPLRHIKLNSSAPIDWNVNFDSQKIDILDPGESTEVNATVIASDKAIAGDYQLQIDANTTNVTSKALFRITVSQTFTWGLIGVLIIIFVIAGIGYLFKKYGRR